MSVLGTRKKPMVTKSLPQEHNTSPLPHLSMTGSSSSEVTQLLKSDLMIPGSFISSHSNGSALRVRSQ